MCDAMKKKRNEDDKDQREKYTSKDRPVTDGSKFSFTISEKKTSWCLTQVCCLHLLKKTFSFFQYLLCNIIICTNSNWLDRVLHVNLKKKSASMSVHTVYVYFEVKLWL